MSKDIYQIRQGGSSQTELYAFSGSAWVDSGADLLGASDGTTSFAHAFALRGRLFYLCGAGDLSIKEWTGSAFSGAIYYNGSLGGSFTHTNVVNWRGKARWLSLRANGAGTPSVYLGSFDGTTGTVIDVSGAFGNVNLPVTQIGGDDAVGAGTTRARIILHDDRLVLFMAGGWYNVGLGSTARSFGYQAFFTMDLTDSGAVAAIGYIDPTQTGFSDPSGNRFFTFGGASAGLLDKWVTGGGLASMFSFKGKLYVVGATGEVREVVNGVVQSAVVFDIRDVDSGRTFSCNAGVGANYTVGVTLSSGVHDSYLAFAVGGKLSGTVSGNVTALNASSNSELRVLGTNGVFVPAVSSGTVTLKRGRFRQHADLANMVMSSYLNAAQLSPTFHERNGIGYLVVPGQWARTSSSVDALSSYVIKWDGTGTTFGAYGVTGLQAFEITRSGGDKPNFMGMSSYLDPEDGTIHIRGVDGFAQTVFHLAFSTTSNTCVDVGIAASFPYSTYRRGWADDNFIGWNINEGGVVITGITKNTLHTQATIAYTLYSADSHALDVALEYDKGDGFTAVSSGTGSLTSKASSPSGTAHTYVHNLNIDLPGFVGNVAYRIRIL